MIEYRNKIISGDCLDVMRSMPDGCVDLVITSPPYEAQRTYGIGFKLKGQAWVDWCAERFVEAHRVCKGIVAFVVEGYTTGGRWSASPALLMADLHRRGVRLRKPPIYKRYGIPGSGGPYWLRNDYELIVCASHGSKLPWSHNTAMGHPPKFKPGGPTSHRLQKGERVRGRSVFGGSAHSQTTKNRDRPAGFYMNGSQSGGIANPGNVIDCGAAGNLGNKFGHENEAPFPSCLAEFFIRSFCPPGGLVFDPFCGSGTTLAQAKKHGRDYFGIDIRDSQVELSTRHAASINDSLSMAL